MIDEQTIDKLAHLSRISISDNERKGFLKDFEAILGYVSEIASLPVVSIDQKNTPSSALRNIMREDENPHEKGVHTDEVLREAPRVSDGYIKVKKILH